MTYVQAIILGLLQGVTELFPVSSLGHTVILPTLLGWKDVTAAQSASESYFLAFLVGLHVATALALVTFYWRTWRDIVVALGRSTARRRIETPTERLGWLLVVASIPAGLAGLLLEHPLRTLFAIPLAASVFLFVNGLVLSAAEIARRRGEARALAMAHGQKADGARRLDSLEFPEAGVIGLAQTTALLAGISRSGITMAAGLVRGLDHEDAARFSARLDLRRRLCGLGLMQGPILVEPCPIAVGGPLGQDERARDAESCVARKLFVPALLEKGAKRSARHQSSEGLGRHRLRHVLSCRSTTDPMNGTC